MPADCGTGPAGARGSGRAASPFVASGSPWHAQHPKKPCHESKAAQHPCSVARLLAPGGDHGNISLFGSKYRFFAAAVAPRSPGSGTGAAPRVWQGRLWQQGGGCVCGGVTLPSCFVGCGPLDSSLINIVARSWFGLKQASYPGLPQACSPGSDFLCLCRRDFSADKH